MKLEKRKIRDTRKNNKDKLKVIILLFLPQSQRLIAADGTNTGFLFSLKLETSKFRRFQNFI